MSKVDFKKEYKQLFSPPKNEFVLVDVPVFQYIMVDGHGDPNVAQEYRNALEALYAVAYKLKFFSKKELGKDYVVPPLQGLWWADDMESFTTARDKSAWDWTMMIMQPGWVTDEMFMVAIDMAGKGKELMALTSLRYQPYREGLCVQILHIGSYDDEGPTLARMHKNWIMRSISPTLAEWLQKSLKRS
jgi:hypothetical protein